MSITKPTFWSWTMGRSDYLVLKAALVVGPALYLVGGLLPALVDWVRGAPLHWASVVGEQDVVPAPVDGLQDGAGVLFDGSVVWTIPDPSAWQRLLALVPGLEILLLTVLGSVCLWRLLTRIRSGDPFGGAAVGYVRALAVLVLSYAVLVKLTRVAVDFLVTAPVQAEPATFFTVQPGGLVPLVLGLLLLALAECFRQGARLQADVDGLV